MRLIDADAALAKIDKAFQSYAEHGDILKLYSECRLAVLEAPTIEARPVVRGEWISVTERHPEETGMYIVTAFDGHAKRVTFVNWQKRNRMWQLNGARSYWRVTHWMPLPEPPNCNADMRGETE